MPLKFSSGVGYGHFFDTETTKFYLNTNVTNEVSLYNLFQQSYKQNYA